ncbi:MAG: DUF5606 domain-containing protein [Formosa sp.]|jgi:hypothetical protein|nr:DUF5606 domain-containing protein [Formosa sp.]MDC0382373.1 DUF5606 domain-containing protein [Flavobacteriaceae bacterium]MDC0462584.1 DUF5606 domain-containing protein [Flavobacteriaceae bacterium]|tara:strand:+ start:1392 stop:1814 length:423 start_codon:yes stop_codon:yes gene_type:complete
MELDKILAISKKPGLYKLITQSRGGFIAESLLDKKRISVSISSNVSVLSEIAIYTLSEEIPIKTVFSKIFEKENGNLTSISPKASKDDLEAYFFSVLSDYDEDRVYASDIKKVLSWYNLLNEHKFFDFKIKTPVLEEKEE